MSDTPTLEALIARIAQLEQERAETRAAMEGLVGEFQAEAVNLDRIRRGDYTRETRVRAQGQAATWAAAAAELERVLGGVEDD